MQSLWPLRYPLYLERLKLHAALRGIDFTELRASYRGTKREKYLDFRRYVRRNLYICRELGLLNRTPRRRILDIGCGGGMFLYCAKYYGHEGVGIDIDDDFYARMAERLGVDRRFEPVRPFQPLLVEGKFDVVTCIATAFDRYYDRYGGHRHYWSAPEWSFFLSDLEKRLTPDGKVFLWLNRQNVDREVYDDRLREALWHSKIRDGKRRFLLDRASLAQAIATLRRTQGA